MYSYKEMRPQLFTESGMDKVNECRRKAESAMKSSSVAMAQDILPTGDSWLGLACIDYLVEKRILVEIPTTGAAQHRVFMRPRQ